MMKRISRQRQQSSFKLIARALITLSAVYILVSTIQHNSWSTALHSSLSFRVPINNRSVVASRTLRASAAAISLRDGPFSYARSEQQQHGEQGAPQPVPVFITYKTTLGLCNQLLSHINALAMASYMRSALIIATPLSRTSFSDARPTWHAVPPDTILDVQRMQQHWQGRSLTLLRSMPSAQRCLVLDLSGEYSFTRTARGYWQYLVPEAAAELSGNISTLLARTQEGNQTASPCVRLELGNPHMLLNQEQSVRFLRPAAEGLFVAPNVTDAAAKVLGALRERGHAAFDGLHLRIESDFADSFLKATEDPVAPYIRTMRQAGLNTTSPVYVASGVFGAWNSSAVEQLVQRLRGEGVVGTVLHKEELVPAAELRGFNPEQLGLIDLLVLEQSGVFVGDPLSSFACYLREMRALRGVPKSTFFGTRPQMSVQYYFARRLRHVAGGQYMRHIGSDKFSGEGGEGAAAAASSGSLHRRGGGRRARGVSGR